MLCGMTLHHAAAEQQGPPACPLKSPATHLPRPQVARCRGDEAYDTEKADVWSCGVTLYCMLAGRYPFMDADHQVRWGGGAGVGGAGGLQ